jgi:transcriptional regulator with XRE-family HTH domain
MTYINKLRHYRTKRKHTQQYIADILGIDSTSRLSSWEQGKTLPSLQNIFKLSIIYEVPIETLYRSLFNKLKRHYELYYSFSQRKELPTPPAGKSTDELLEEFADMLVNMYREQVDKK